MCAFTVCGHWNLIPTAEVELVLSESATVFPLGGQQNRDIGRCDVASIAPPSRIGAQESTGNKSVERITPSKRVQPSVIRTVPGCLMIGLITFVCYRLQLTLTVTGFIYLIAIVLQSLIGRFISSALVSVVAVLCLDFFFTPPRFSLEVTSPLDILALISFLTTGLVVSRLNTRVREEAAISDHQRRQVDRLYRLAQMLLAVDPEKMTCASSIELFQNVFDLRSVCLFDAAKAEIYCTGPIPGSLADQTRDACSSGRDGGNASSKSMVQCLRAGGNIIGAIGIEGLDDPELTSGPLSALAAAMLERANTFRNASHVAAAAQAELFRGAILHALAHEFKTPLATIVTAAGGLRELGPMREEQLELTDIIEAEASRLSLLTSRLLRTAQLDREEVKPQLELTDMADLVVALADQYSRQWTDRKLSIRKDAAPTGVMADADLLQLALRQLLDNACKYSVAGSAVTVSIDLQDDWVNIRTSNSGSFIRPSERSRIFERFYRGAEAQHKAPGSGLGLYVARKIVHAHGGSLDLETGPTTRQDTAFLLSLPLAVRES
jgi:two-component system, OmpR family, sensor histidine kinase KdpD